MKTNQNIMFLTGSWLGGWGNHKKHSWDNCGNVNMDGRLLLNFLSVTIYCVPLFFWRNTLMYLVVKCFMMSEINSQMFLKNMYIKREKSNSAKCQQVLNFGEIHYIIFVTFLQV